MMCTNTIYNLVYCPFALTPYPCSIVYHNEHSTFYQTTLSALIYVDMRMDYNIGIVTCVREEDTMNDKSDFCIMGSTFSGGYTPSLTLGNHLMIFSLLQTLTHANQCIIFFSQEHNISVHCSRSRFDNSTTR